MFFFFSFYVLFFVLCSCRTFGFLCLFFVWALACSFNTVLVLMFVNFFVLHSCQTFLVLKCFPLFKLSFVPFKQWGIFCFVLFFSHIFWFLCLFLCFDTFFLAHSCRNTVWCIPLCFHSFVLFHFIIISWSLSSAFFFPEHVIHIKCFNFSIMKKQPTNVQHAQKQCFKSIPGSTSCWLKECLGCEELECRQWGSHIWSLLCLMYLVTI